MTELSVALPKRTQQSLLQCINARWYRAIIVLATDDDGMTCARLAYVYARTGERVGAGICARIAAAVRDGLALVDDDLRVTLTPAGDGRMRRR